MLELRSSKIRCRIYNICIIILATQFYFFLINKDKSRSRTLPDGLRNLQSFCTYSQHQENKKTQNQFLLFDITLHCLNNYFDVLSECCMKNTWTQFSYDDNTFCEHGEEMVTNA